VPAHGHGDEDKDAELALELLRALADQELARSERSASRARQVFALAAGFFAIVQTVAFGTFASDLVTQDERREMLVLAGIGGGLLVICGLALLVADRAFGSVNVTPDNVLETLNEGTGEPATYRFVELYARVVEEFRKANENRQKVVVGTQLLGLLSLVAVLVELVYGLHARLS
jgi:hypothetical protein